MNKCDKMGGGRADESAALPPWDGEVSLKGLTR